MSQRRWSLAALAFAPILALAACDQASQMWERMARGGAEALGPAALDDVPLEARALAGSVQPQDQIAALLAPEPLLIAPGQILVGARVEAQLAETATEMGLANNFIRSLRSGGVNAMAQLPRGVMSELRTRAEGAASDDARRAAQDVLGRLGVGGEVQVRPGGIVTVNLLAGASPTALHFAQQVGEAAATPGAPNAIEWNEADRCPRIVTQGQLESDVAMATRCAIQRLQASGQFAYVEPNYIAAPGFSLPPREQNAQPAATPGAVAQQGALSSSEAAAPRGGAPNDPLYALQWHYRPRGTGEGKSPGGAGFSAFWDINQVGSSAVRVAVIDTGIDMTVPDIRDSGNVGPGVDLISNPERGGDGDGVDADPQDAGDRCGGATEDSFHGTHVAGTIGAAATNDRIGVAGGAWDVTVIPVRVLGRCGGELADVVSGVRWAAGLAPVVGANNQPIVNEMPADIINMSLSLQTPCPASLQQAISDATARGSLVVVAAGNKANRTSVYAPANCRDVIVVAANDARGELAFYSNFGPEVDVVAPGGDVFADTDNDGRPDGVLSTRATTAGCYDPLNQDAAQRCYYSFLQGTSMAAPHVSAALALLAAQTNLRGGELEGAFFTRAVGLLPQEFGRVECARSRNATPVSPGSTMCDRPHGRGMLDLSLAVQP